MFGLKFNLWALIFYLRFSSFVFKYVTQGLESEFRKHLGESQVLMQK